MATNITGFAREVACLVHGFYQEAGDAFLINNKVGDKIGSVRRKKGRRNYFIWNGEEEIETDNAGDASEHIQYGPLFKECFF